MDLIAESTFGGDVVTGDKMSGWNWDYRVVLHETEPPCWHLHEVYYNDNGEPAGWTDAASPYADADEGPEGVAKDLAMMLHDALCLPPLMVRGGKLAPWCPEDRATRRPELGACASSGEAAEAAVEATKRRYEAWHMQSLGDCMCYHCQVQRYGGTIYPITDSLSCPKLKRAEPPLEADDSRVTDGRCGAGWCSCGKCVSRQATGTLEDVFGSPRAAHKCCGGKPDCGCGG